MERKIFYFLILNAVLLSIVLIYVRHRRKKINSSELAENDEAFMIEGINKNYYKQTRGTNKDYKNIDIDVNKQIEDGEDDSRPVNVVFTWNGHDWDAYEVLGLPAGSSLDEVQQAYEEALSKVDNKSQKIIEKAYVSICQKVG